MSAICLTLSASLGYRFCNFASLWESMELSYSETFRDAAVVEVAGYRFRRRIQVFLAYLPVCLAVVFLSHLP